LKHALTGGSDFVEINGERKHVIGYMKDFLFGPEQARTPIGRLSGGERGRLMLAQALARPSNLLVLDEPTNDLDLETLDLLQEMLADYKRTLLIVSHDRDFLDRVTTSVLVAEGGGRWIEYAGGYSDMVAQRGAGVSAAPTLSAPAACKDKPKTATVERAKPRLSSRKRQVLDNLPARIEELRALKARLQSLLDGTEFYARNPAKFVRSFVRVDAYYGSAVPRFEPVCVARQINELRTQGRVLGQGFQLQVGGRLYVDGGVNSQPAPAFVGTKALPAVGASGFSNQVGIRQARLQVEGTAFKFWDYKFRHLASPPEGRTPRMLRPSNGSGKMRVNVLTGETLFRRAYIRSMVDQVEVDDASESSAAGRFSNGLWWAGGPLQPEYPVLFGSGARTGRPNSGK
jgi:energy-coupling factor transporter ATP-binding protein EcfA2